MSAPLPSAAAETSTRFCKSLGDLADPAAVRNRARDEFLSGASQFSNFDRRAFLKIMGASLALASLPACTRQPIEKIVPYTRAPENLIPGRPLFFATAMTLGGFATGLLVESDEGHPTKIEGNPDHPASLGATGVFQQAALLDLYDPDRSQAVLQNGQPAAWDNFVAALHAALEAQRSKNGSGLRLLTETVTSPTLHFQIQQLLKQFPGAHWHQWEPINRDNVRQGARVAYGEALETHYHFERAKVIVSLESDFLSTHPNAIRYARDFASRRRAPMPGAETSRFYAIESTPSVTGTNADHRLPLPSAEIELFALQLAAKLGMIPSDGMPLASGITEKWISVLAEDLTQNRGAGIVIAGESQPPTAHALAHILNHHLGNLGQTVTLTESAEAEAIDQTESLKELVAVLARRQVDVLLILGGNPAFNAPADFQFAARLASAAFSAHLSSDVNETSALCRWHVPQNHFLESWSDARSFDGMASIVQPLIMPLYAGKSAHEVLDAALAAPGRSDYEIVREFWRTQDSTADFDSSWQRALHDGLIAGTARAEQSATPRPLRFAPPARHAAGDFEISFRPDSTIRDGAFANNGWLQELPKPISQLVWDNAALISPAFAKREQLSNGDVIELTVERATMRLPVWVTPGQAENSIALSVGYGRRNVGRVGAQRGFDVFPLRQSGAQWFARNVIFRKTNQRYPLVTTQTQHAIDSEERQILRVGTLADFKAHPDFVPASTESPAKDETLFNPDEFHYDGYRWGMAIDLSACIGCAACTVACQAENNIPVVGKTEVGRGRIMHWIRVDDYFRGAPENPDFVHQPVPCMHCENAPCELVCPVGATVHDKEGLNLQVYNRCVGTRYCSNNCPYKVRRFNFFQYADYHAASLKPLWNPNVTVRWRGVMEKCTYCIQRISEGRISAEEQGRKIRDGDVRTACQQVCPAEAIVFGDLSDPNSRVSKSKSHALNYAMLGELNTRPRTTYLAKLRNPHPKLA